MKDTIQNNFSKSQKFSRQLPVAEFRSGFVFALHSHFTYDSEICFFAKLYAAVFRTQSNIEDEEIGENKMNSHQRYFVYEKLQASGKILGRPFLQNTSRRLLLNSWKQKAVFLQKISILDILLGSEYTSSLLWFYRL